MVGEELILPLSALGERFPLTRTSQLQPPETRSIQQVPLYLEKEGNVMNYFSLYVALHSPDVQTNGQKMTRNNNRNTGSNENLISSSKIRCLTFQRTKEEQDGRMRPNQGTFESVIHNS